MTPPGTGVPVELLPATDEAPRCSNHARMIGLRPAGTGLHLDRVLLVPTPEPWPKPATAHPRLKPLVPLVTASAVRTRLFASSATEASVELYERTDTGTRRYCWRPVDDQALVTLVAAITAHPLGEAAVSVTGAPLESSAPLNEPTLLVCVQGSHDVCCGTEGVAFADAVGNTTTWPAPVAVKSVSHTGGHRFAPTLLALPSGRMWANVDLDLVARIIDNNTTADDLTTRCRGWWGAPAGPAQMAEIALTATAESPRSVDPSTPVETAPGVWQSVVDGEVRRVELREARKVPTIACGALGGLPVKERTEYEWTLL